MEFNFQVGEKVLVEITTTEIYEGDINACGKNYIEIRNIRDYIQNTFIEGAVMTFYRNEIVSVHPMNKANASSENLITNGQEIERCIKMPKCDFERLKKVSQDFIYMSTMDARYHSAMEHIHKSETVGIVSLGNKTGRSGSMSLLAISTWDQVYLFDLKLYTYNEFPRDIKFIFLSKDIKKVVHDSRPIVDSLHHCYYRGNINSIFDTQVADKMLQDKRNVEDSKYQSLGKCLSSYFNFPENFLTKAMEAEENSWDDRPLSNAKKLYAAELATYLITLKNHMETLLLKDFYDKVYEYSHSTLQSSPVSFKTASNI